MKSNRKRIINELKRDPDGFTVSELSKKLNLSRQTISNCFAFLEGAEKVKIRQVGMAKVYYIIQNKERKNDK
jgi:predicted transcriptional regulator